MSNRGRDCNNTMSLNKTGIGFLAASALCAVAIGASAGDTRIENPLDEVNEHFAVASEHFGDGQVQLHSRLEGTDGTQHEVHTFDCKQQTYRSDYQAAVAPDATPIAGMGRSMVPITQDSYAAPLAQHACAEHGHPLLEWRW